MNTIKHSFEEFSWRSRLFLNSQILIRLLSFIAEYKKKKDEDTLVKVFLYAHFLDEKYSEGMYPEMREHIQELLYLEGEIKKKTIDPGKDKHIVGYVIDRTIWHFTGE